MSAHDDSSLDEADVFAREAITRSEHASEAQDRFELLARAQAWAMLRIGDTLTRLVDALATRRARP